MKKIVALFLSFVMIFGVTACGGDKEEISSGEKQVLTVTVSSSAAETLLHHGRNKVCQHFLPEDLPSIVERRILYLLS